MTTATLVDWTSEYFTYLAIWAAAVEMRECGERAGAEGLWSLLSAVVLANTAYEGFTNHLIESLFPEAWTEQRRDYRGRLGKTKFVAERLAVILDRSSRPYRGVAELSAWRNQLVHPRTARQGGIARADVYSAKPKKAVPPVLATLTRAGFVADSFLDVENLADTLLRAAADLPGVSELGESAFWGPHYVGGASLKRDHAG